MTQQPRDPNAPAPPPPAEQPSEPAPAPQQSWQSQPQQPAAPPPGSGVAASAPLPPGPVAGTQIADFVTRLVAYIIDGVILGLANFVLSAVLFPLLIGALGGLYVLIQGIAIVAVSAGYFIYFWTTRRQTAGMMLMKLLVVEDGTGATLTQDKAIRRWIYLGLPLALSTLLVAGGGGLGGFGLAGLGGLFFLFTLATIVAIASAAWQIYLAYATNQDARKQGPHDKAANSVVVSYGPSPFKQQTPG